MGVIAQGFLCVCVCAGVFGLFVCENVHIASVCSFVDFLNWTLLVTFKLRRDVQAKS